MKLEPFDQCIFYNMKAPESVDHSNIDKDNINVVINVKSPCVAEKECLSLLQCVEDIYTDWGQI